MRMKKGQPLRNVSFLIYRIPFTHMSHKSPKFTPESFIHEQVQFMNDFITLRYHNQRVHILFQRAFFAQSTGDSIRKNVKFMDSTLFSKYILLLSMK